MEYGYSFDEGATRYELRSLWFLLGVVVFAFSVLIMASILDNGGAGRVHLTEPTTRQQQTTPATTGGSRGVSPNATPYQSRQVNNKGA
jgi:hypothetical protein